MNWKILLITDSRGRGLLTYIKEELSHLDYTLDEKIIKGATLDDIWKRLERTSRRTTWDVAIVVAGICNFTELQTNRKRQRYLQYTSRKSESTRQVIDSLFEAFGPKVHICTIPPASIKLASKCREDDPSIEDEQQKLIQDIEETNRHIINCNINRNFATIDLARQTYSSSVKGKNKKKLLKFTSKGLNDGVHPNSDSKILWAKYMAKVIPKIVARIYDQLPTTDSGESDSERESWDHKRLKHQQD